jgi:hypothetical protein
MITTVTDLRTELTRLRAELEKAFGPDTAMPGSRGRGVSGGQCAAVAVIVYDKLGGSLVSTTVEGESHWFNRFRIGDATYDADITGDQWERPRIQIADRDRLYASTRVRRSDELNEETLRRAATLANRAGIEAPKVRRIA